MIIMADRDRTQRRTLRQFAVEAVGRQNVELSTELFMIDGAGPCAFDDDACEAVCDACSKPNASAQDFLVSGSDACKTCVQNSLAIGGACNRDQRKDCPKKASCPSFAICAQSCL